MAICQDCAEVGDVNRRLMDGGRDITGLQAYPEDCGCDCQKITGKNWEDIVSIARPK